MIRLELRPFRDMLYLNHMFSNDTLYEFGSSLPLLVTLCLSLTLSQRKKNRTPRHAAPIDAYWHSARPGR